jgi:hypothetical protein
MSVSSCRIEDLSPAQRQFAEARGAVPGLRAADPRMIFMYRKESARTFRWLVDQAGRAVDITFFPNQHLAD